MGINIKKGPAPDVQQVGKPEVKMTSTAVLAKLLREYGITVNRGEEMALSINMDSRTVEVPEKMEGTTANHYFLVMMGIMDGLDYNELSKRYVLQKGYKRKTMTRRQFGKWLPAVLTKQQFLPSVFVEQFDADNLYKVTGTLPSSIRKLLDGIELPTASYSDINEDNFKTRLLDDDTELKGPFADRHWMAKNDEVVKLLTEAGADPKNIWTVDRLVKDTLLEVPDYTLLEMHQLLPGSKMEDGKLLVPCTNDEKMVTIEYGDDRNHVKGEAVQKYWYMNGRQVVMYHYVPGYGYVSAAKAVWAMINYLMESRNESDIEGKLAYAPGMFVRGFHSYAFIDNKMKVVAKGAVGIWNIRSNNQELTPVLFKEEGSDMIAEAANYYIEELKIPAVANATVDTLYAGDAAIQRGYNLVQIDGEYYQVNTNDQSKPGKTFNRGQLAASLQALVLKQGTNSYYHKDPGGDITFGSEKMDVLEPSGMRMVGSTGEGIESMGMRVKVWLTNWTGENMSGVVTAKPDFKTQLAVRKQERYNEVGIFCNGVDPDEYIEKFFKTEELYKAVWPGEPIAWLNDIPVARFGMAEQHVTEGYGIYGSIVEIGKPKATNIQTNLAGEAISFDLEGTISLLMTYNEEAAKFRAPGCKWTAYCEPIEAYDEDYNPIAESDFPDQIAGTENIKQDDNLITIIKCMADTLEGGIDYDSSNINDDGTVGLTPEQQDMLKDFRVERTSNKWIWTPPLQKHTFWANVREYIARTDYQFRFDTLQIGQLCTVLEGDLVLQVEVSTVRENVGVQAMISEQLAALACIYRPLALELWDGNSEVRDALISMLEMADEETESSPTVWEQGALNNPDIWFDQDLLKAKGPRGVFRELHKKYPDGLTIQAAHYGDISTVNLRFDALAKFSVGKDPVGNPVIQLLQHLSMPEEERYEGWDNFIGRVVSKASRAMVRWAGSKGNAKAVSRTGKVLHGRKVKPISRAWIQPGEVGLHPNDPLIEIGKREQAKMDKKIDTLLNHMYEGKITEEEYTAKKDELLAKRQGLVDGDHILISRSPMISVVLLKVVVTDKAPIGTYLVSEWDWHRGNEGDGDGDPSAALRVPGHMVKDVREALKTSVFGPVGYYVSYDTADFKDLPIMDFYRGGDKKRIDREWKGATLTPVAEAVQTFADVGNHYTRFVGKSFAMCSALTFKVEYMYAVAELLGTGYFSDDDAASQLLAPGYDSACAKVWRRVYEGLALSGISDTALEFARHVGQIGRRDQIILKQMKGDTFFDELRQMLGFSFDSWIDEDDNETELARLGEGLAVEAAFKMAGIDLTVEEAEAIRWSIHVTYLYGQIEKKNPDFEWDVFIDSLPEHLQDETVIEDACVYGSLRRIGAGMDKRKGALTSMITRAAELDLLGEFLPGHSIMGSVLDAGGAVQTHAAIIREKDYYSY